MLLTYVAPAIPLVIAFDGAVSILTLYLEDELRELVNSVDTHRAFEWDIGSTSVPGTSVGIFHLMGIPRPSFPRGR
mgnify:CR=1 FL=1